MLSLRKLRSLGERGDTIVEVLISIAVISLILGGAYVTTNKSLQGTRAAQERGDSLKLAESQLEAVKSIAAGTNSDAVLGTTITDPFCVISSTTVVAATNAQCKMSASGATATSSDVPYSVSIHRTNGNEFTVTNTWPAIEQGANDKLQMTYRVYGQ